MRVILQGNPNGEHLRAEVDGTGAAFYSHHLRDGSLTTTQLVDQFFFSLTARELDEIRRFVNQCRRQNRRKDPNQITMKL